jgi:hypothetical protein
VEGRLHISLSCARSCSRALSRSRARSLAQYTQKQQQWRLDTDIWHRHIQTYCIDTYLALLPSPYLPLSATQTYCTNKLLLLTPAHKKACMHTGAAAIPRYLCVCVCVCGCVCVHRPCSNSMISQPWTRASTTFSISLTAISLVHCHKRSLMRGSSVSGHTHTHTNTHTNTHTHIYM